MSKKNLNKEIRKRILAILMNKAFEKEEKKLKNMGFRAAELAYEELYQPFQKELSAIPDDFAPICSDVSFYLPESYGCTCLTLLKSKKLFPHIRKSESSTLNPDGVAYDSYIKYRKAKEKMVDDRDSVKRQIEAVLLSCRTFNSLYETWPELVKFAKEIEGEDVIDKNLPALPIAHLNILLGLSPIYSSENNE